MLEPEAASVADDAPSPPPTKTPCARSSRTAACPWHRSDVVTDRASSTGSPALAVALLIRRLRDDSYDAAGAQVPADRSGGVRLVAAHPVWAGAGSARAATGHAQMVHQDREHGGVAGLPGAHEHDQRQPPPLDEVVDLRAHTTAGAADRVIRRFLAQILVIRQGPLWSVGGSSRADGRG